MTANRTFKASLAALAATLLAGCVSVGIGGSGEPPEQLLTLTSAAQVESGAAAEGSPATALAVQVPGVSQRLNVNRIPVSTGDASLAYLANAYWVEKPASLFQAVLAETIRARGNRFVLDGGGVEYAATTQLTGELVEMTYDAPGAAVVVRYDAVLLLPDGNVRTRRFEHKVDGVLPEAMQVGRALNVAVNVVAQDVAQWVD